MGQGTMFALRGETGIIGHRETDGGLHVYLGFRTPEGWIDPIDFTNTTEAKKTILNLLDGWTDTLRGMIADADTPLTPAASTPYQSATHGPASPASPSSETPPTMSPFAGEGANLAMYDASDLALAEHPQETEEALAACEAALFPSSAESAGEPTESLKIIVRDDSPKGLVVMFAGFDAQKALDAADALAPYAAA